MDERGAALLRWFDKHRRDLPWRRSRDPYAIWVSEIMLQQTRVAAVLEHYRRWMERFPTMASLAAADESEVLARWSGLGYYRRARMLHNAARKVVAECGGEMPRTAAELRLLPGIGEYTAAAVASIAFGEAVAVVDGNVERVCTRLAALAPARGASAAVAAEPTKASETARAVRALATNLLTPGRAGDSNQAIMELGATICLPKGPLCLSCPVQPWCLTRGEHVMPVRKAALARSIAYALVRQRETEAVALEQREGDASLMAGMWELPQLVSVPADAERLLRVRHAITVTNYTVDVVRMREDELPTRARSLRWTTPAEWPELPLTGLARKILKRLELWPA